jgi:hypothetical protein
MASTQDEQRKVDRALDISIGTAADEERIRDIRTPQPEPEPEPEPEPQPQPEPEPEPEPKTVVLQSRPPRARMESDRLNFFLAQQSLEKYLDYLHFNRIVQLQDLLNCTHKDRKYIAQQGGMTDIEERKFIEGLRAWGDGTMGRGGDLSTLLKKNKLEELAHVCSQHRHRSIQDLLDADHGHLEDMIREAEMVPGMKKRFWDLLEDFGYQPPEPPPKRIRDMLAESGLVSVEHQRKLEDAKEKLQQKEEQRRDTETQAATKKREREREMQRLKEEIEELKADLARKPEPGQVQPEPQQQVLVRAQRNSFEDLAIVGAQNADKSEADLRKELKSRKLHDYPNATDKNLLIAKLADDIRRDGILGPENAAKSVSDLKKELKKRGLSTSWSATSSTGTELDVLKARLAADITRKDGLKAQQRAKESELKQKKQEARVAKDDLAESKQVHEEGVATLKAEVAALKRPTAIKTILDKHGFGDGVLLEHLAHADEETLYNIRLEFEEQGAPSQMVTRFERAIEGARPCPGDVIHEQLCKQSIEQLEHKAMGYIASGHVEGAEVLGARHDKDALVKLLAQGEIAKHEKERAETRRAAEEKVRLKKEAEDRARAEENRRAESEKQKQQEARDRGAQFTVTVSDFGDADTIEDLGLEFIKEEADGKTASQFPWLATNFHAGGKVVEESTFVKKGTALVKITVPRPSGEGTSVYDVKQEVSKSKEIIDVAEKAYAEKTPLKAGDPQWQNNGDATSCPCCDKTWGRTDRVSHCRLCGKVVCPSCCENDHKFGNKEEKVCNSCVKKEKEELEKLKLEVVLGPLEQFLAAASGPLTLTFQPPAKGSKVGSADFLGSAAGKVVGAAATMRDEAEQGSAAGSGNFLGSAAGALGGAAGLVAAVANNPLAQMAASAALPGVGGALLAGVGNAAGAVNAGANIAGAAAQAGQAMADGDLEGALAQGQNTVAQARTAAA